MEQLFDISFRCYYPNGNHTDHRQTIRLDEIRRWVEAYSFTHPQCESISVKVWLHDDEKSGFKAV